MKQSKTIKAPIITLRYPSQSDMYPCSSNPTKEPTEVERPRIVCQLASIIILCNAGWLVPYFWSNCGEANRLGSRIVSFTMTIVKAKAMDQKTA